MKFDSNIHHRRSIRLKGYDYSQAGAYFVTIVAWQREMLFGEIVNGETPQGGHVMLNEFGKIVQDEWERTGKIRREVELGAYIVMPNHFHGIVVLLSDTQRVSDVGATGRSPLPHGPAPKSLGALVAGFKSSVTKRINTLRNVQGIPVWQRNYYERIIRNDREMDRITRYIESNPSMWAEDEENPMKSKP